MGATFLDLAHERAASSKNHLQPLQLLNCDGSCRIGAAYARMMSEGHKMDIVYYDPYPNKNLEDYMKGYGELLKSKGERPVTCTRVETMEEVFKAGDVHLSRPLLPLTPASLLFCLK